MRATWTLFLFTSTFAFASGNPYLEISDSLRTEIQSRVAQPSEYPPAFIEWYNSQFCLMGSFCFPMGSADPADTFVEWKYNHEWSLEQRVVLHCNLLLLIKDQLLPLIESISYIDTKGSMRMVPSSSVEWFSTLESRKYTSNFKASRGKLRGLRSSTIGIGIHTIEHVEDLDIEVHYDFENPGRYSDKPWSVPVRAWKHTQLDLNQWEERTPNDTIKRFSKVSPAPACGLSSTDLKALAPESPSL